MPNRPSKASLNETFLNQSSANSTENSTQYGLLSSLPAENLAHITAYLDPDCLFTLSLVCRAFYEHVKDEHTWYKAFLLGFLGITPESDVDNEKALVLRRTESSWRKEYVSRFNLTRRWERSRNTTVTHVPVHSPISRIHLMQSNSLLSSSLQYGIVARSVPLHGKIMKGFLSPSPSGTGLGIGNPNTEFAPNVTACALTSEGGTAKIVWGFRNGEIAVMTAARTMETNTRSAARLVRCKLHEEHEGEVTQVEWDDTGSYVASASKDGRIKVWDAKKVRCVWISHYLLPDTCVSVAICSSAQGYTVTCTMESGDIWIWAQITLTEIDVSAPLSFGTPSARIPSLATETDQSASNPSAPASLHVDGSSSSDGVHVYVTYPLRCEFWGISFEYTSATYRVVKYYSDETCGAVTALYPCPANERGFVIAGYQLGWIAVYPQADFSDSTSNTTNIVTSTPPSRKVETHPDGSAVTALAWNGVIVATGSGHGSTTIIDACTFQRLRVLSTPVSPSRIRGVGVGAQGQAVPREVKQILLGKDRDFLVVSVGDRAMAFKADVVTRNINGKSVKKSTGKQKARGTGVKGYEKLILDQLITESIDEHDKESQYLRKVHRREREHHQSLHRLGLDEVEAVEYVLMLSREEALQRAQMAGYASGYEQQEQRAADPSGIMDDDVFEGDFDDIPLSSSTSSHARESPSPPFSHKESFPFTGTHHTPKSESRPIKNRGSPSTSNQKIRVSPRARKEPREAGFGDEDQWNSAPSSQHSSFASSVSSSVHSMNGIQDEGAFPSISVSPPSGTHSPSDGTGSSRSLTSSPGKSPRGAWTNPLKSSRWGKESTEIATASSSSASQAVSGSSQGGSVIRWDGNNEMDEDLKLAIELSLKSAEDEARRRVDL